MDEGSEIIFCVPEAEDGYLVHQLVADSPPLDTNSLYCNLLQCSHFARTSICAKRGEELLGFISGYRIPDRPDTLFVWQVVVSASGRGKGLGTRMLMNLIARLDSPPVRYLETTITEPNKASWGLFEGLARRLETTGEKRAFFTREKHFRDLHDTEYLYRIGPFESPVIKGE